MTLDHMHTIIHQAEHAPVPERLYVAGLVLVGLADIASVDYRHGALHHLLTTVSNVRSSDKGSL